MKITYGYVENSFWLRSKSLVCTRRRDETHLRRFEAAEVSSRSIAESLACEDDCDVGSSADAGFCDVVAEGEEAGEVVDGV